MAEVEQVVGDHLMEEGGKSKKQQDQSKKQEIESANETMSGYPSTQAGKENAGGREAAPIELYRGKVGLDHQVQKESLINVEGIDKEEVEEGPSTNRSRPNK